MMKFFWQSQKNKNKFEELNFFNIKLTPLSTKHIFKQNLHFLVIDPFTCIQFILKNNKL